MSDSLQAVRARCDVAPREIVEALHDIAEVISIVIHEFAHPDDKASLRNAMQGLVDVAIEHDALGGYRIYPAFGEEGAAGEDAA